MLKIDKSKATAKWSPILESMGVSDATRQEWMAEMAEYNSLNESAYANGTIAGMGAIFNPTTSTVPGQMGLAGSGDVAQNLLPVSMKIAAQTIGLDLVSVKPTPGPKMDLLFMDFQYEDTADNAGEGRPQVFMLKVADAAERATLKADLKAQLTAYGIKETRGGLNGRMWVNIETGAYTNIEPTALTATGFANMVEFLGFSRVYALPMFRAYRQNNAFGGHAFKFVATKNTFNEDDALLDQILMIGAVDVAGKVEIELISALDDHLPGFVTNFLQDNGKNPMNRQEDDDTYANNIGPRLETKTIHVGTVQVSSALRRTDIEDIKANAGIDILQKMESVLVNELSQTISKQIVNKIWEMGDKNRATAPLAVAPLNGRADWTIFDLDTDYVSGVQGETTHAVQRKLTTKMRHASHYIAIDGRIGTAQFAVTNGSLAATLIDSQNYAINAPINSSLNMDGQLYPVGKVGGIEIYVDPYMALGDNRMVLGRKNAADQPGIIFVPYLMAQSFQITSEATWAPRILLRSRYAVAEVGFYPEKQFITIEVQDDMGLLN